MMEAIEALFVILIILTIVGVVAILILPAIVWAFVWTLKILCIVFFCYVIYRFIQGVFG